METLTKDSIIAAAKAFMTEHGMKPSDFARRADVNKSYLSVALRGTYVYQNTTMPDSFFRKVAAAAGFDTDTTYWKHVDTEQYVQIINTLIEARNRVEARMIVGPTGSGKTYAVDRFCQTYPVGVYRITVNDYDTIQDILKEIVSAMGLQTNLKRGALLRFVARELKERSAKGLRPILVIDEAENTKVPGIKAYKALYDLLRKCAAFILVCTPELPAMLEQLKRKGVRGMPQFCRRMKAGTVNLLAIDRSYKEFMADVDDQGLKILLPKLADNYGELHDYMERAIREADENGEPLTEDLFRVIYNLPKN